MLSPKQIKNGEAVLSAVAARARSKRWGRLRAKRMARMVIECCLAESNLLIFANEYNAESLRLPHDAVGHDHDSVGMFQQRVPSWGTTHDCMDPVISCHKFMDRASEVGADRFWMRRALAIQKVQVSYDASGSNYAAHADEATAFVYAHWDTRNRRLK